MTATALVTAVLAADRAAVAREVGDTVAFNSPLRRYERHDEVVHLLGLLGRTMPDAKVERVWSGPAGAVSVLSATLPAGRLDAVLEELHDETGKVREVTLLLRPHAVMMPAIQRMGELLAAEPAPGADAAR